MGLKNYFFFFFFFFFCVASVASQLQSFVMARYPLTGSRVSLSDSTRERGHTGKGQLTRSQADSAGHESPGEDCGRPHQKVGVNRPFPVWLIPGTGTTDAIFVVRQLLEKYLAPNRLVQGMYANAWSHVRVHVHCR